MVIIDVFQGGTIMRDLGLLDIQPQQDTMRLIELPENDNDLIEVSRLNDKHWVTKHNELIQSTYKLSLQQQRILLIIASRIQPKDENFKLYQFNTKDIIDILGLSATSGSYYAQIKTIVNDLQTKTLTIKTKDRETNLSWVITSDYFPKQGFFQVELHPKLKPYFLELKDKFTKYRLENVLQLNSSYSIRMYELLKQYEGIGCRKFQVDELKDLLAIPPSKYKQYGHFKSKILLHSQEQIEKHTDLRFEFKEFKTGRKITRLEFQIQTKKQNTVVIETDDIMNQLFDLGITGKQAQKIKENWDDEHILRNLEYTNNQIRKKRITSPAGYFIQAVTEDYGKEKLDVDSQKTKELKDEKNIDFEDNKYGKPVTEYESLVLQRIDLQRTLEVDEETIEQLAREDMWKYCTFQLERYGHTIESNQFSDGTVASYCAILGSLV